MKPHTRCYAYASGSTSDLFLPRCKVCGERFQVDDMEPGYAGGKFKVWGERLRQLGRHGEKAGFDRDGRTVIKGAP